MSCTRERVFSGIAEEITAMLQAEYGDSHECSRDISEVPEQTQPEATPRCWLWELESAVLDDESNDYHTRTVTLTLIGYVRLNTVNSGDAPLTQTLLNELEAVLDGVYLLQVVNGVKIVVRNAGSHRCAAGAQDGVLEMPLLVEFAREA